MALTGSEFNLLSAFVASPQRVLTRDHLLNVLHNRDWDTSDRSIDVLVNRLRRKLGDSDKPPSLIRTVRGIGYLFAADVGWG
ncbi:hypothetical protein CCP2SC5_80041 [Azospirillaceae bacterium]